MNITEAIRVANERDYWFRPVGLIRMAYCIKDNHIFLVPSSRGGIRASFPSVKDCLADWEVVAPSKVCEEENLETVLSEEGF